jgi:hypothetical protein
MLTLAVGCVGGDDTDTGADTDPTGGDDGMTMTATMTTTMTTTADDTVDDSGSGSATGDTGDTGTDTVGESSSSGPDPTIPEFNDTPFEDYVQQDRKGFPAINTGLNILGDKDAYNASNPAADATAALDGVVEDIEDSLNTLHRGVPGMQTMNNTGLDDDLIGLGLDPCVPPQAAMDDCITQAGPFAIPDTLNIDTAEAAGFPNGRLLGDPVMDIILAVLLLDLDGAGGAGTILTFTDLDGDPGTPGPSLNPLANDVAFPGEWPYLAPANE